MKPLPPDYWTKKRIESLKAHPLKRSSVKRKEVKIRKFKIAKIGKPESLGRLIQKAVTAFHKWIRERDSNEGMFECISCWKYLSVDQMQAGHYLPAGNNGAIRLSELNVNGQCVECNVNKNGNQDQYRIGLIGKIGLDKVEELEAQAKVPFKWDRAELEGIISKYN